MTYKTNQDFYDDLPDYLQRKFKVEYDRQSKLRHKRLFNDFLSNHFVNKFNFFLVIWKHAYPSDTYWRNLANGKEPINFKSNNMISKEQALEEIKQLQEKTEKLKQYVEQLDEPKQDKITTFPDENCDKLRINGRWAATIDETNISSYEDGRVKIFLYGDRDGFWTNDQGVKVKGRLLWNPK